MVTIIVSSSWLGSIRVCWAMYSELHTYLQMSAVDPLQDTLSQMEETGHTRFLCSKLIQVVCGKDRICTKQCGSKPVFLTATLSRLTFDLGQLGVELTLLLCTSHLLQDQYSPVKGAGKTHSEDCVCVGSNKTQ